MFGSTFINTQYLCALTQMANENSTVLEKRENLVSVPLIETTNTSFNIVVETCKLTYNMDLSYRFHKKNKNYVSGSTISRVLILSALCSRKQAW